MSDPLDLAPVGYWDAGRSTLLNASDLAPSDGDTVKSMTDLSGGGWTLAHATDANRPIYKTNIFGSQPVLRGNGTSQFLSNASFSSLASGADATWFIAFKADVTNSNDFAYSLGSDGPRVQIFSNELYVWGTSTNTARFAFTSTATNILAARFDGSQATNATRMRAWLNGDTEKTLTFANTIPATIPAGNGVFWANYSLVQTLYFDGDIAAIIAFDKLLTDQELNDVGVYFAGRFGTTWTNLPGTTSGNRRRRLLCAV